MEEERGANKWSGRTNNQDTILNILEITQFQKGEVGGHDQWC